MSVTPQQIQALLALSGAGTSLAGQASNNPALTGTASNLSNGASALGAYEGLASGNPLGEAQGATSAGRLAGNLSGNGSLSTGAGDLNDVLGIYSGIQRGGVTGYGQSAADSAQLAGNVLGNPALSAIGGYVAAPLSLYNAVNDWQSGNTGSDTLNGAEAGASIGSIVPGIGTVIGGLVGAAAGALSSAFGGGKPDPESESADALDQSGTGIATDLTDPQAFQYLAGVMDAKNNSPGSSQPLEQVFGRQGEGTFLDDMADQINSAVSSGQIAPGATASQIYSQVVAPWLSQEGAAISPSSVDVTGANEGENLQDSIEDLISGYTSGSLTGNTPIGISGQEDTALPTYAGLGAEQQGSYNEQALAKLAQEYPNLSVSMNSARGGSIRHFQDGGIMDDDDDDTSDTGDYSDVDLSNIGSGLTDIAPLEEGDLDSSLDSLSDLGSDTSSSTSGLASALNSLLGGNSAGILAGLGGLLAGVGAATNDGSNMTSEYNPSPPAMFGATGSSGTVTPNNASNQWSPQLTSTAARAPANMTGTNWNTIGQSATPSFFQSPTAISQAQLPSQTTTSSIPLSSLLALLTGGAAGTTGGSTLPATTTGATATPALTGTPYLAAGGRPPHVRAGLDCLAVGGNRALQGTHPSEGMRRVRGPGDGTDDRINAKLSDGEYVIPAHIVSALGNGSNDAGAEALDRLQEHVRKRVGKQMAHGQHPRRIGQPLTYMREKYKV